MDLNIREITNHPPSPTFQNIFLNLTYYKVSLTNRVTQVIQPPQQEFKGTV